MEEYLHPYFLSQRAHVGLEFKLRPPLQKRAVGRQRKNRIPSCLGNKGNKAKSKGKWQVQCSNCLGHGYRSTSPKCPLNGKKGVNETTLNTTPAMNTRRQLALNKEAGAGTSQEVNTTTTMEVITTMEVTTPIKKKRAVKKQLTPRKANN
uniref:Uncharacterized protein n=1 Tax=Setaria italica TaxID=4555 RepID=K4AL77_SETIT